MIHIKNIMNNYNNAVLKELLKMCDELGFNPELLTPKTIKGEIKPLGIWEFGEL